MSKLVVIAYDDQFRAEEVRTKLRKLQQDHLVDLAEALVAVKDDQGEVTLLQMYKPAAVVEKLLAGKLDTFYPQNVLTEQAFVKDQDKSIGAVLDETGKLLGDKLTIRRYVRLQIGA